MLPDHSSRGPIGFGHLAVGAGLALLVGLGLFYRVMAPSLQDLALIIELMGATALVSILAVYAAFRAKWITRSPHLRWTLIGGYLLAGFLVFLNVYITARMMFTSQHDLLLATILLVFATGIAVALGFYLAETVTTRIDQVNKAACQVFDGSLDTRVSVEGRDEVAQLAESFNTMVAQIEAVEHQRAELDHLRRDLVAWAGHDLRTPLTSIRAILEAMSDGLVTDEATRLRYLQTAQANIQSLSRLIDDLFEVSQVDAGGLPLNFEPASIADLVSDTLGKFATQASQQGITLEGKVAPGCDPLEMDTERIGRVLANLVSNAMRYTPRGGKINIVVAHQGEQITISVQDNGEGISPVDLPYVFERFYRGEKSRSHSTGGAGLGLAITKGIVEAHHGKVGIASTPGAGTTVWFNLPRRQPIEGGLDKNSAFPAAGQPPTTKFNARPFT
jgi:signal transduction histidine kinase